MIISYIVSWINMIYVYVTVPTDVEPWEEKIK